MPSVLSGSSVKPGSLQEPLGAIGTNTFVSSWSSDGKLLVYSQTGATSKSDVWVLPLDGDDRKPRRFQSTDFSEGDAQISPDGLWVAYTKDSSFQFEVYAAPILPGRPERQLSVDGGVSPRWRRNGSELFFISKDKLMAIEVTPGPEPSFGALRELFRETAFLTSESGAAQYQPSADGRQFLALVAAGGPPGPRPLTVITNWQSVLVK